MNYIKLSEEEFAKILAGVNAMIDVCEEQTQGIFDIEKINKNNVKEATACQAFYDIASEGGQVWRILNNAGRKLRV